MCDEVGQTLGGLVPAVRTMEPREGSEQRRGVVRCLLQRNPPGCRWRLGCGGHRGEQGRGGEALDQPAGQQGVVRSGWIPDIGTGRSVFYFKNCTFGFHFSLLFKANAPGFLLTGVMESFKCDYFSKKGKPVYRK